MAELLVELNLIDFRNLDPIRDSTSLVAPKLVKSNIYSSGERVNTGRALLSLDYDGGSVSYLSIVIEFFSFWFTLPFFLKSPKIFRPYLFEKTHHCIVFYIFIIKYFLGFERKSAIK